MIDSKDKHRLEKANARAKLYYQNNKDKVKAYKAGYQSRKKWELNEISSEYYYANKEEQLRKNRDRNIKKRFNLSRSEYDAIMSIKICGICQDDETSGKSFVLDHCHNTNKVRGVLCRPCNAALGVFKDNIETLQKGIQYLEKFK